MTEHSLKNKIFLYDQFHQGSAEKVTKSVIQMFDAGERNITIYINSYGGDIVSGFYAIKDVLDKYRKDGLKVTTVAVGAAKSCGAFLLLDGDVRLVGKNAEIMTHGVQAWPMGSEKQIREVADKMTEYNAKFAKQISDKTGITIEQAVKLLEDDREFTAEEAVRFKLADAIWAEEEAVTNELSDYIQKLAASAENKESAIDAMRFMASVNSKKNKNKEDNMSEVTDNAVELKMTALKDLNSELTNKVTEKDKMISELQAKVKGADAYKAEFFEKQKDKMIASACKLVAADKMDSFKAKLEKFKALEIDAFEETVHEYIEVYGNAVPAGLSTGIQTAETRKIDNTLSEEEKAYAEFRGQSKKVDYSIAKKLAGAKIEGGR